MPLSTSAQLENSACKGKIRYCDRSCFSMHTRLACFYTVLTRTPPNVHSVGLFQFVNFV